MTTSVVGALGIAVPQDAFATGPSTVTQTFSYTGSSSTFTVPSGITSITVTMTGGQGGRGGTDSAGPSPAGGYRGLVTGTMTVTPGQVLTIAVGSGGATGSSGAGQNSPTTFEVGAAVGGSNPLSGYGGGNGGVAGYDGSSGYGGAGGAASLILTGSTTIVAGGSGGAGGSGQFAPTQGRAPYATFLARSDTVTGAGEKGISTYTQCLTTPGARCDGGGGGAGGGGVQGGAHGDVQFGSGSSNEWYGYGGYPGQNSTGSVGGLVESYQYYPDNSGNGSITIAYAAGAPGAPTSVIGLAGDASVALAWTAPTDVGQSALTDYVVQYALASSPTSWTTFTDGVSTGTSATVTGLSNGTGYVFQVIGVNAVGNGTASASTGTLTPSGPPAAPTISVITAQDGGLSVAFTAGASGSTILDYEYRLDGTGPWISTGLTGSPLLVTGLTNGTPYAVVIRAVSAIGNGASSNSVSATPQAVPGAPTITAVSTGAGSAAVSFTPGYSGGGAITGYDYLLTPGIGTWASLGTTTSPLSISGLANGTAYSVAIRARTSSGPGAASQTSGFTTPDVPGAPAVSITRGDRSLAIAYTPGNPGGSTITGYQYSTNGGTGWTTATTASPIMVTGLTNGTTYSVSVRAVNTIGDGAPAAWQDAIPATVPGAPSIVGNTVAGSSSQLSAAFTAPASDGGSAITTYEFSTDAGATWRARGDGGTTLSPLVISTLSSDGTTPLVNGTTYSVELRAVNAVGRGLASALATGIAGSVPGPPTITAVTGGSGSLQVGFTPGANGGAAITGYEYQLDSGGWTSTGTLGDTFTITGRTNGTSYAVSVRATNSVGTGAAATPVSGTPGTTPAQPTISSVTRGDHLLTVAVADADNGGLPITDWQYSTDGGTTWHSAGTATSPLVIGTLSTNGTTPIANGTSYPIAVRAVNAAGASVASATMSVGPSAAPSAPTVTLTAQNQAISVVFTISSDGGSPVSAIEYNRDGGGWVTAGTLASPFTIASLTNGTAYSIELRARNAIGPGNSSTPASATPMTEPDAPTAVGAVSNTASADVTWTAPVANGGSAITAYTATAYTAASGTTTAGTPCTTATVACSITALTNGTLYYVSVVAQNAAGASAASSPRVQVTPLARPGAPTLSSLTPGNAFMTLAYSAGSAGSSAITGYQYQLNGGAWLTASSTSSPLTISGVSNGTSYTVALRAVSLAGVGTASGTLSTTPYTYPDAPDPLFIIADGRNASIVVSWAAPASNGSTITGYTATAFNAATAGGQVTTCATSGALTCTLTGLSNGTTYYVSLQALNAAGLSARSAPRVSATPALLPGAVSAVTGVSDNGQVTVSWTAGSTGATAITDYQVWYASGGSYTQFIDATSTATSTTVTGLTNGTPYTFKIYAVNSNGTGPASAPSSSVTPLAPGTVPTTSTPVRTVGGFTILVTNYSSSVAYGVVATGGASVVIDGSGNLTVTGLAAGASSTVTVTATRPGYTTTSASMSGSALGTGATPTFSTPVRTVDGYSFDVTSDPTGVSYGVAATSGSVSVDSFRHVTVVGLAPLGSSTVTVTATRAGFTTTSASLSGSALDTGVTPTFSMPLQAVGGFTATVTNYSSSVTYAVAATGGASVVIDVFGNLTVTGLGGGASSTVTVTATRAGYTSTSASVSGSALDTGVTPTFSTPTRTVDGYTFTVTNYSSSVTYAVAATGGASVVVDGSGNVTVTGLGAGVSATVTVTATRAGYTTTAASVSGSALDTGVTPTFSTPTRTGDGYTFTVTNYSSSVTYAVAATGGASVMIDGSGNVTVTGLGAGVSSTVTVTVTQAGYTTSSAWVTDSASPAPAPPPSSPAPTPSPTPQPTPTPLPPPAAVSTPPATAPSPLTTTAWPRRSPGPRPQMNVSPEPASGADVAAAGGGTDLALPLADAPQAAGSDLGAAQTTAGWLWILLVAQAMAIAVPPLLILWRRRRREDEEPAPPGL